MSSGTSGSARVTGAEAKKLVAGGALLLDVRTPEEYSGGHVEGAVNIPVQTLGQRLGEVGPKEREVVVYCQMGGRSARAAAQLRDAGYKVHDLGGMASWNT